MPHVRAGLWPRPRLATAAAVLAVAAVLVMHGGLDARALASHLTIAAATGDVAPHGDGDAAAASPHGGVHAHAGSVSARSALPTSALTSRPAVSVTSALSSAPAAADHASHGHALGHVLVACAAVLLAVGALVALVALGRHLRRGVLLPWSSTASPATWLDRLVPVPPPRVALCVERC